MTDILLHVCCGPCTCYPLEVLRGEGYRVSGYFFNPNIHPYREFQKRKQALDDFCLRQHFQVDMERQYGLTDFLRQVVHNETKPSRCRICYAMRLEATAKWARDKGADAFSTTLLYSRYQDHELIKTLAEKIAENYHIPFYYADFREGWQAGIDMAVEMELYRQPYCGCIYSEQERYDKKLRKKKKV